VVIHRFRKSVRGWQRHVLMLAWAFALIEASAGAAERPLVVFTIDVESNEVVRLPFQTDMVCTDGTPCGLSEISRLLRERGWSGVFFLNVYEHRRWGESALRRIAVALRDDGHEVALHTHPQWSYDPGRTAMHEYTLDEQTRIIREGVRTLEAWTGQPVVAHRAGAYTADAQTLEALTRNGIPIDSSYFWQHPGGRLGSVGLARNLPSHAGVREIPVTVYERAERPALLSGVAPLVSIRKLDPDWFRNSVEARAALDGLVAARVPVLVVFLHSFSFISAARQGGPFLSNDHSKAMFRVVLDYVQANRLPVVTMRDILEHNLLASPSSHSDTVPRVNLQIGLTEYARYRAGRRSLLVLGGAGLVAVLAAALRALARPDRRPNISPTRPYAGDPASSGGGGA
jgi:peptidoglycan/xylan/chitin deacetylase (PgdA/CDA1 family)